MKGSRPKFKPKKPKKKVASTASASEAASASNDSTKPVKPKTAKKQFKPRHKKNKLPEHLQKLGEKAKETVTLKAEPGVAVASTVDSLYSQRKDEEDRKRQAAAARDRLEAKGIRMDIDSEDDESVSGSNSDVKVDPCEEDTLDIREQKVKGLQMESNWETAEELWTFEDDPVKPVQLPFVPESVPRSADSAANFFQQIDKGDMEIVESQDSKLFFMQFPKELPLVAADRPADGDIAVKQEPQDPSSIHSRIAAAAKGAHGMNNGLDFGEALSLKNVKPGKVGKLKVYRSGKVKLHFENVVFDVSPGVKTGFTQQVTAINVNENSEEKGSYMPLASVGHKLVCTPDVSSIPL